MERNTRTKELELDLNWQGKIFTLQSEIEKDQVYLSIASIDNTVDIDEIRSLMDKLNVANSHKYEAKVVKSHGIYTVISASDHFEIFDEPQLSPHSREQSGAKYLGWTKDLNVLIQANGRNISSSFHGHDGNETIIAIFGNTLLHISKTHNIKDSIVQNINRGESINIPSGDYHQIQTLNCPSVNILVCNFTMHHYPNRN